MGLLCFFPLSLKAQKNKNPSEPWTTEAFFYKQYVLHVYQIFSLRYLSHFTLQHAADLRQHFYYNYSLETWR